MPVAIITQQSIYSSNGKYIPSDVVLAFNCDLLSDKIPSFRYDEENSIDIESDFESVKLSKGIRFQYVRLDEIVRLECKNKETTLHLRDNSLIVTRLPIDVFTAKLKTNLFYSVHPEHLVNLLFMERLNHSSAYLTLSNFESVPVSPDEEKNLEDYLDNRPII
ncbi:MAG: LytTR family transcriptional regulator DNA-binding domain-containing protein [Bacteroidales bacterium]